MALTQMGDQLIEYGHEDEVPKKAAFGLIPISAPYYVTKLLGCMYNTQGGPKRSANCEVIDIDGNPIPGLYSAGEMGCEYAYIYNVGGKVAAVEVAEHAETNGIGTAAIAVMSANIVAMNGTEGVDALSGASVTSRAVLQGAAALQQATA